MPEETASGPETEKMSRGMKIGMIVGAFVLIGPTIYVLQGARWEFGRTVCVPQCAPQGMDYRIEPIPSAALGEYPAVCRCVKAEKKWWQFWKSAPPAPKTAG